MCTPCTLVWSMHAPRAPCMLVCSMYALCVLWVCLVYPCPGLRVPNPNSRSVGASCGAAARPHVCPDLARRGGLRRQVGPGTPDNHQPGRGCGSATNDTQTYLPAHTTLNVRFVSPSNNNNNNNNTQRWASETRATPQFRSRRLALLCSSLFSWTLPLVLVTLVTSTPSLPLQPLFRPLLRLGP
jgi:hypothetical protein